MADLFNRNLELRIRTFSTEGATEFATSIFRRERILANLNKSIYWDQDNTGQISVTNVNIQSSQLFASAVQPLLLLYSLHAGYGREDEELLLFSEGHISETNWSHLGGDTTLQFFISEGSKYLLDPYRDIGGQIIPKGQVLLTIIQMLEEAGQRISYIPNRELVLQDLAQVTSDNPVVFNRNFKQHLLSLLTQAGYTFFEENTNLVIYRRPDPNIPNSYAQFDRNTKTTLNFKTGLLSADLENSFDYVAGVKVAWLNFSSLFIPSLVPASTMIMNEPRYPHLAGEWIIYQSQYSLNNKDGEFKITGKALHKDFVDPSTGLSQREILRRAFATEREGGG